MDGWISAVFMSLTSQDKITVGLVNNTKNRTKTVEWNPVYRTSFRPQKCGRISVLIRSLVEKIDRVSRSSGQEKVAVITS